MNYLEPKVKSVGLLIVWLVFLGVQSCTKVENASTTDKERSFEFALIQGEQICTPPNLGPSWETAWPVLQQSYPSGVVYSFTMADIETYNWSEQVITLTESESETFSMVVSNNTPSFICYYAFLVLFDGAPLYGGRIVLKQSNIIVRYPVVYLGRIDNKRTLTIRPYHFNAYLDKDDPLWKVINDVRVEEALLEAGKLVR